MSQIDAQQAAGQSQVQQSNPSGFAKHTPSNMMDLHTGLMWRINKKKLKNWSNTLNTLFPAYTHLKRITGNWTTPESLEDKTHEVCRCRVQHPTMREVDLIDLMGQRKVKLPFCSCMPNAIQILACGYLASTPVYPQTAFLLRLLNFYHLLWNLSNVTTTSFAEVLRQWNKSLSVRLCSKNSIHVKILTRNLSGSIEVYRLLVTKQQTLVETITSTSKQNLLAQQTCPACFGTAIPITDPSQPCDTHHIFICLDGNFQNRHHKRASKNHLPLLNFHHLKLMCATTLRNPPQILDSSTS
ncbi:hypothetical protein VP01_2323g2 [Puccinia sorghi]|uniref:CxC1-like cysteine cluster associated with KDZ transposases domain-containing protein n=1 Tax=Puccinia sorghi TaxID=27349 RepID=A0A0L6V9G0_9BASI|nr:hypothetical protein VP01_2323g2 [Puccinia sorghi]